MIQPTVGRIVWFHPYNTDSFAYTPGQPCAAIIARVWSNSCVNLSVFDHNGNWHSRTSVLLVQDGEDRPSSGFCEWMPYQEGQAAKAEQLEKQMAEASK